MEAERLIQFIVMYILLAAGRGSEHSSYAEEMRDLYHYIPDLQVELR